MALSWISDVPAGMRRLRAIRNSVREQGGGPIGPDVEVR
jgi:hypothetical protein